MYLFERYHFDPNVGVDFNGDNALITAAKENVPDLIKLYIENGADVNSCDKSKLSVLSIYAGHNDLDMVKYLIEKKADVNAMDERGYPPIAYAIGNGAISVIKYFIDELRVNLNQKIGEFGLPLLQVAIQDDNLDSAKLLISKYNFDINETNKEGANAIVFASLAGAIQVMKYFIYDMKLDVINIVYEDLPLFFLPVGNGHLDLLKFFLEKYDIDPDFVEPIKKYTLLHLAALTGQNDIVAYLTQNKNVDVDKKDYEDESAFDLAYRAGNLDIAMYLLGECGAKVPKEVMDEIRRHLEEEEEEEEGEN